MIHLTPRPIGIDNRRFMHMSSSMKLLLLSCFAIVMSAGSAQAENFRAPEIAFLEAGILCGPETTGTLPAPGTIEGATHIIENEPDFVSTVQVVPAVLGLGFGVKSQSVMPDGIDSVEIFVSHPEMGETAAAIQSFTTRISGANPSLTFYQFDHIYELVHGTWKFMARSGETTLYAVSFEVVDPRLVPELASLCGYMDLLS